MARPVLPTDFKDDVLAESMSGKRRYRIIQNADGTVSLDDVTDYEQVGSVFGAKQVNDMSSAVNSIEDVKAANNCTTTEPGFVLDARQGKTLMDKSNELSRDLNSAFGYRTVGFDLNTLTTAIVWGEKFTNAPTDDYFMVISAGDHNTSIQLAQSLHDAQEMWHRSCGAGNWNGWTKKNGRSGTIAGAGAYWKDPPAGQYREWATGCVRWDEDNLVVTVEDDYEQGHLKVGAVVGKKGDTPNWGDKAGGLLVLKY